MSLTKRVLLYLLRKRGRSILLMVIIFIMSTFLLVGISVKSSADQAAEELRKSIGSSFILEVDDDNPSNYGPPVEKDGYSYLPFIGPVIGQDLIEEIMKIDGVSDCYTDVSKLIWTELELRPGAWAEEVQYYQEHPEHLEQHHTTMDQVMLFAGQTSLYCCSNGALHSFFRNGSLEISNGRNIQTEDSFRAVISEELAQRNGLQVGDSFIVENKEGLYKPSDETFKTWGQPICLTVVGFFHTNFVQEASPYTFEDGYAENIIFTDMKTSQQIDANLQKNGMGAALNEGCGKVTFFVNDPNMLDQVLAEVRSIGRINGLLLKLDDVAYRASAEPLQEMSGLSSFLIITSILGVLIILYLILNMWIKSRKREIGILLSMGIKKISIRFQLMLECALTGVAALILSFSIAGYTINGFGKFTEQMAAPDVQEDQYDVEVDARFNMEIEKVSAEAVRLDYTLDIRNVVLITVLVLGISAGSVCLASLQLLRRKPKDILSSI